MRIFIPLLLVIATFFAPPAYAQTPPKTTENFYQAIVIRVNEDSTKDINGYKNPYQKITVQLLEGPNKGKNITIDYGGMFSLLPSQKVTAGETIIVDEYTAGNKTTYSVLDKYRLGKLLILVLGFCVLAILAAGKKGLGALIGMGISIAVIVQFIVPQILSGSDPLFISIVGAIVIMLTTTYLAHGISRQTSVAVVGTFCSLILTGVFSYFFVMTTSISGAGDENAFLLKFGMQQVNLNIQGLVLGGIIIGAVGALNDITTTQAATIFELAKTDKKLSFQDLVAKGLRIGKEHIASLVNTLVLAYAGTSLSIFIILQVNPAHQPLWTILNSEVMVQEIVRTIAGSMGLILAVPITTLLAAFVCKYKVNFT